MDVTKSTKRSSLDNALMIGVALGGFLLLSALSGAPSFWTMLGIIVVLYGLVVYVLIILPFRVWNRVRRIDERLARIEALLEARMNRTAARPEQKDVR